MPAGKQSHVPFCACAIPLMLALAEIAVGEELDTKTEIETNWALREADTSGFELKWTEWALVEAGRFVPGRARPGGPPAEDAVFERHRSLIYSAKIGARFEDVGQRWSPLANDYTPQRLILAWNGERLTRFTERPATHNRATIHAENTPAGNSTLRPVFLGLRPAETAGVLFGEGAFRVADVDHELGDFQCVVIETSMPQRQGIPMRKMWLDAENGYLPLRYTEERNGRTTERIDITYAKNDRGTVYPKTWSHKSGGVDGSQRDAEATSFDSTRRMEREEVELKLPAGTFVYDNASGEPFDAYVVVPGGERRKVLKEEVLRSATVKELMATEPGEAGLRDE